MLSTKIVMANGESLSATPSGSILPSAASTEITNAQVISFSQTSSSSIEPIIYWLSIVLIAVGIKLLLASYSLNDVKSL